MLLLWLSFEVFASATFYSRFFWGGATILLKPVLLPLPHHTTPIYTGTGRGSGWQRRPSLFSQWYSGGLVTVCFYPSLCVGVGGGGRMGTTVMVSTVMHSRGHFSLNLLWLAPVKRVLQLPGVERLGGRSAVEWCHCSWRLADFSANSRLAWFLSNQRPCDSSFRVALFALAAARRLVEWQGEPSIACRGFQGFVQAGSSRLWLMTLISHRVPATCDTKAGPLI